MALAVSSLSRLLADADLQPWLRLLQGQPRMTHERIVLLSRRALAGDDAARNEIVLGNLRLVLGIAASWAGRGVEVADLVAEGNVGLLRAAEKFDPARRCRFSTYATWWITQSIRKAVRERGHAVRVPSGAIDEVTQWRRARKKLAERLGRDPTDREIATELGLSPRIRERLRSAVAAVEASTQSIEGLPEPCVPEAEEPLSLGGIVTGNRSRSVAELLEVLDPRSREVLVRRLGLDGGKPATLVATAELLGISRERVRQIEQAALARLRVALGVRRQVA